MDNIIKKLFVFFFLIISVVLINSQVCNGNFGAPVFYEDFGTNNTPNSYNGPLVSPPSFTTYNYVSSVPDDGFYTVSNFIPTDYGFHAGLDHTTDATNAIGNMMIVNASYDAGEFYRRRVSGLCENQIYRFSTFIANVLPPNLCTQNPDRFPIVKLQIQTIDGSVIGETTTGQIASTSNLQWNEYFFDFQTPNSIEEVEIVLINDAPGGCGNDLAIDDISFRACGPTAAVNSIDTSITDFLCDNSTSFNLNAQITSGVYTNPIIIWQQSNDGINWTELTTPNQQTLEVSSGTYQNQTLFRYIIGEGNNVYNSSCNVISDVFQVIVNTRPEAPTSNGDRVFCMGEETPELSATSETNTTINWYDSSGNLVLENSTTYTPTQAGIYEVESVNTTTLCTSASRTTIELIENTESINPPLFLGNGEYCEGEIIPELTVQVNANETVNWYNETGELLATSTATFQPTEPGNYFAETQLIGTNCKSDTTTQVALIEYQNPDINLQTEYTKCINEPLTLDAGDFSSILWEDGSTNRFRTFENAGTYSVEVLSDEGCFGTKTITIVDNQPIIQNIVANGNSNEVISNALNLPLEYSLDLENWQSSPIFENLAAGNYEFYVKDNLGCISEPYPYGVFFIPNTFTPNNDQINDEFNITGIESYKGSSINIYDKYGKLILEKNITTDTIWDGLYLGRKLPTTTYWYVLTLPDNTTKQGWIFLNNR